MKKSIKFLIISLLIITVYFVKVPFTNAADKGSSLGCWANTTKSDCNGSTKFACVWTESEYGSFCNVDDLLYVKCGDATDIPVRVPRLFAMTINLLKIAVPIILVIVGIITLVKAVGASKEDEIKKAQTSLIKKLISGALIFFIVSIVQFVITTVADSSKSNQANLSDCLKCFLNNSCEKSVYYKASFIDKWYCISPNNGNVYNCDTGKSLGNLSSMASSPSSSSSSPDSSNTGSSGTTHGGRSF